MPYAYRKEKDYGKKKREVYAEMKERTAAYILETGKSATKTAKALKQPILHLAKWAETLEFIGFVSFNRLWNRQIISLKDAWSGRAKHRGCLHCLSGA